MNAIMVNQVRKSISLIPYIAALFLIGISHLHAQPGPSSPGRADT